MKRLALIFAFIFVSLVAVILLRTVLLDSKQIIVEPVDALQVDEGILSDHLAHALRFPTISSQNPSEQKSEPFLRFHDYLAQIFPESHRTLSREIIGGHSLLFAWSGKEPDLKPILFLAHQDVVPAESESLGDWTHSPFSGDIDEGYIWGRGALDDKVRVLATLESLERLIKEGYQPRRTIYLAFGHDEEVGGMRGAAKISELLRKRGIEFEYVFDEGGAVTEGVVPGISSPVALVGIAEKGYLSLELGIQGEGGHSSRPPPHTIIGILSTAIHRLEGSPFPSRIDGGTRAMIDHLAPELPLLQRMVLANLWLFEPLVEYQFSLDPTTDATIRTTLAVTMIEGGFKENVLPTQSQAVVNLRLLPGDTLARVTERVRNSINDPRITIHPLSISREPSLDSRLDSWGFEVVHQTIREIFPEAKVAPFLVVGGTDSYHFGNVAADIYRFSPLTVFPEDLKRIHGIDERISIDNYVQCVRFYYHLIRNSDS